MYITTDHLGHSEIHDGNPSSSVALLLKDPIGNADLYLRKWNSLQEKADSGDKQTVANMSKMRDLRRNISDLAKQGEKSAIIFMYRLGGMTLFRPDELNSKAYEKWTETHPLI